MNPILFLCWRAPIRPNVGHRGLGFFLVPLAQEGIDIRPINQLTGTAEFNEVFFDGAACGAEDLVGEAGRRLARGDGLAGF